MKEVLTKSFWRGVTKTFYEALEGPPPKSTASQKPARAEPQATPTPEAGPRPKPEKPQESKGDE